LLKRTHNTRRITWMSLWRRSPCMKPFSIRKWAVPKRLNNLQFDFYMRFCACAHLVIE
jgi:hypothetical protein